MIQREPIYRALFQFVRDSAQFAVASRRLRHWSDVAPAEQPALFMSERGMSGVRKALGAPIMWTLRADFYIYAHCSDPARAPAEILNPLIDAVEAALAPSPVTGIQNLGLPLMVQWAYLAGKVEVDEGVLGDQAVACLPVEILAV